MARQVEIDVAGGVEHGVLVAFGAVGDIQTPSLITCVRTAQCVGHPDLQRAGIALLSVGAHQRERHIVLPQIFHRPHPLVEAHVPAVEGIGPVVRGKAVLHTAQGEPGPGDAVGIPPHQSAHILVLGDIVLQRVEPQHHVQRLFAQARELQGPHRAAVGDDLAGRAPAPQGDLLHRRPVGHMAKDPSVFLHKLSPLLCRDVRPVIRRSLVYHIWRPKTTADLFFLSSVSIFGHWIKIVLQVLAFL